MGAPKKFNLVCYLGLGLTMHVIKRQIRLVRQSHCPLCNDADKVTIQILAFSSIIAVLKMGENHTGHWKFCPVSNVLFL
jgi:hypothetical protein